MTDWTEIKETIWFEKTQREREREWPIVFNVSWLVHNSMESMQIKKVDTYTISSLNACGVQLLGV